MSFSYYSMSSSPRRSMTASPRSRSPVRPDLLVKLEVERCVEEALQESLLLKRMSALRRIVEAAVEDAFAMDSFVSHKFGLRTLLQVQSEGKRPSSPPAAAAAAKAAALQAKPQVNDAAWDAAMSALEAMKAKPASVASRMPAMTFIIAIAPIAYRMETQVPLGLERLWEAARADCKVRRAEWNAAARNSHLRSQREPVNSPVEVKFPVKAKYTLPTAPYASVPWLTLLSQAADEPTARRTLQAVVDSAAAPQPKKIGVESLATVFRVATTVEKKNDNIHRVNVSKQQSPSRTSRRTVATRQNNSDDASTTVDWSTAQQSAPLPAVQQPQRGYLVETVASMAKDLVLTGGDAAMPYRNFVSPTRLAALKMLIDVADPPLHPEPFCAAPATLKAMADKKAALAALPPPSPAEAASLAAKRAGKLATSSRLLAIIHSVEQKERSHATTPEPSRPSTGPLHVVRMLRRINQTPQPSNSAASSLQLPGFRSSRRR